MKTTLIKLKDKFILVSDEEIKHDDFGVYKSDMDKPFQYVVQFNTDNCLKLIAHEDIPELPSIDFSLLSEEDCKTIGWVDVEKLFKEKGFPLTDTVEMLFDDVKNIQQLRDSLKRVWIKGFKTAQSLNDKMFSLEEMKKAINLAYVSGGSGDSYQECEQFIEEQLSLQQTSWDVEVEMGYVFFTNALNSEAVLVSDRLVDMTFKRPKIKNNSIKIIKLL